MKVRQIKLDDLRDKIKSFFYLLPVIGIFIVFYVIILFGSDIWSWIFSSKEHKWTVEEIEQDYHEYVACSRTASIDYGSTFLKEDVNQLIPEDVEKRIEAYNQVKDQCCTEHFVGCGESVRIHANDNLPKNVKKNVN